MAFNVELRKAFQVVGVKISVPMSTAPSGLPTQLWDHAMYSDVFSRLLSITEQHDEADEIDGGIMGFCVVPTDAPTTTYDYWVVVEQVGQDCPEGMELLDIPASEWAVFDLIGSTPQATQQGYAAFPNALAKTSYRFDGIVAEVYPPGNMSDSQYKSSIWVKVVR